MKVAVIGSGISGLGSAYYLSQLDGVEVSLFESRDRLGGHTNTRSVTVNNETFNIDTGFIVCNDRTYPNFLSLLNELGVALKESEMSFSVSNSFIDLEYSGSSLNTFFCDRRNLFKPKFLKFLYEIILSLIHI